MNDKFDFWNALKKKQNECQDNSYFRQLVEENFKLGIIVHNDRWASKKILNDRNIVKNGEIA